MNLAHKWSLSRLNKGVLAEILSDLTSDYISLRNTRTTRPGHRWQEDFPTFCNRKPFGWDSKFQCLPSLCNRNSQGVGLHSFLKFIISLVGVPRGGVPFLKGCPISARGIHKNGICPQKFSYFCHRNRSFPIDRIRSSVALPRLKPKWRWLRKMKNMLFESGFKTELLKYDSDIPKDPRVPLLNFLRGIITSKVPQAHRPHAIWGSTLPHRAEASTSKPPIFIAVPIWRQKRWP